ncbi:CBS domain-containing protein [Streptomyces ovatisporus]|uniref:CBS domain-containing protein n=1 Tax=Streptomyces ovatisporus TaxID=1128682 RepID=A0ABV9A372_9ACTN
MPYSSVVDLMTAPGIGVRRDTGLEEVAALIADHGIHAVAVVDEEGHPVGVVSQRDLRYGGGRPLGTRAPSALRSPPGGFAGAGQQGRAAPTAGDVMTSPAVTALRTSSLPEAVRTMERRRVGRLPVVDTAEQLVGFLSRTDILRFFLREDEDVRTEIVTEVLEDTLGLGPSQVRVTVTDGRVTLQGIVAHRDLLPVVERLTRGVAGVVEVRNHLAYFTDAPSDRSAIQTAARR